VIAFRHFTKRFGPQVAVDDLSLEIHRGEVVALLGPNGSGKTTSLKAAAALLTPTSGEVVIGEQLRPALEPRARRQTSYLPQKVSFPDSLTGAEVVEFYRALRGAASSRSLEALRAASLNGAGDRTVGTYSGGMVQRLGLAVALVPDAPVLLLDEPTAALDPDGLCTFYGVVERRRDEGRTVLFTSHQLGDVERLADRVAILVNGRLAAMFTESELADRLADRGVMRVRVARSADAGGRGEARDEARRDVPRSPEASAFSERGGGPPDPWGRSGEGGPRPDVDVLLERVRRVAPRATWSGADLVVPGPVAQRPRVIAELQACGAELLAITAEEGRLDSFYRELLADKQEKST
jgi:Cu-processing system ATP-binding protein